jgi:cobalt/nickel transport system ATP-binding protein
VAVNSLVIEARELRYGYPDGALALNGIDFTLGAGETVALLGANGSGKTTFVLHLNGLLSGRGSLEVCGLPVVKANLARIRQKIGLVFQDADNQLFMPTVLEDVAFGPLNLGFSPDEAVEIAKKALTQTGMLYAMQKAPYHLSAGEKKRAAIAGVLAMRPEIVVLDEPTTFLDPPSRQALQRLLSELPQAKLIVTHDIEFAAALATRAVFFERGRIVGEGSVREVAERFGWENRPLASAQR